MRFKLVFRVEEDTFFPFNYQYELAAGLYKLFMLIKQNHPRYTYLKNHDFLNQITFSRIEIPKRVITKEGIKCFSDFVFLKVSLGFNDIASDAIWKAFSKMNNQLLIYKKQANGPMQVINMQLYEVEFFPPPEFEETMKFKMLSPLVLTKNSKAKKNKFCSLQEQDLILERLKDSLSEKFQLLYGHLPPIEEFEFQFDELYCQDRQEKDLYSLIKMKEGSGHPFSVLGILVPFKITAPQEVIKVGYYSGFGEKTSLGFGMVESAYRVLPRRDPQDKNEVPHL